MDKTLSGHMILAIIIVLPLLPNFETIMANEYFNEKM